MIKHSYRTRDVLLKRCPHLRGVLNGSSYTYKGAVTECWEEQLHSLTYVTRPCSMIPPKSFPVIWSSLSGNLGKNWYSSNMFFNIHTNRSWLEERESVCLCSMRSDQCLYKAYSPTACIDLSWFRGVASIGLDWGGPKMRKNSAWVFASV